jgi:hypothetical protein
MTVRLCIHTGRGRTVETLPPPVGVVTPDTDADLLSAAAAAMLAVDGRTCYRLNRLTTRTSHCTSL